MNDAYYPDLSPLQNLPNLKVLHLGGVQLPLFEKLRHLVVETVVQHPQHVAPLDVRIAPHVEGRRVRAVVMRRTGLRWPFPSDLSALLVGQSIRATGRRGKYLLLHFDHGTLIVHLGMSGHLRILPPGHPPQKHDHFDLEFDDQLMRFTDRKSVV